MILVVRRGLVTGIGLLAGLASASHFSWMPLGDSITWGCNNGILPFEPNGGCEADAASYRIPTAQALEQTGITITTVGSRSSGPNPARGWRTRATRAGASTRSTTTRSRGLRSSLTQSRSCERPGGAPAPSRTSYLPCQSATTLTPKSATKRAGANDCIQGNGGPTAIARMTALLNSTATLLPAAKVFVASMLDVGTAGAPRRPPRTLPDRTHTIL